MSARFAFPAVLPVVTALPAPVKDGLVSYAGAPWFCSDGATWRRLSPAVQTVVVDAGPVPTPEVTVTTAVTGLAAGTPVMAWLAPTAPGKDADELPMDVVDVWAWVPTAGQLSIRLTGLSGHLADRFTVAYLTF